MSDAKLLEVLQFRENGEPDKCCSSKEAKKDEHLHVFQIQDRVLLL